jgi:hypothetical protein
VKLPYYPGSLRSEPRYAFLTQPLPSSVPTIDKSVSRRLSRKHTAPIDAPLVA